MPLEQLEVAQAAARTMDVAGGDGDERHPARIFQLRSCCERPCSQLIQQGVSHRRPGSTEAFGGERPPGKRRVRERARPSRKGMLSATRRRRSRRPERPRRSRAPAPGLALKDQGEIDWANSSAGPPALHVVTDLHAPIWLQGALLQRFSIVVRRAQSLRLRRSKFSAYLPCFSNLCRYIWSGRTVIRQF